MLRQKIVLRRRVTPQRVRSPNRQSFLGRYERVSRQNLPQNVTIRQTRWIELRKKCKAQKGRNLLGTTARLGTKSLTSTGLLKKGISAGAKAINSDIGKKLIDEVLYHLGTSKIRNKNVRKALESEVANYVVQEAQKKAAENVENFQIEAALKNNDDPDINDNFVGAFPANQMNKFINYKSMISEKKRKISLLNSKHWRLWQGRYALVEHTQYWTKDRHFFLSFVWCWWTEKLYHTGR